MKVKNRMLVIAIPLFFSASSGATQAQKEILREKEIVGPKVTVAEVIQQDIAPFKEYTGYIAASRTVELRPRVSGQIQTVSVPEGGLVRKGQTLFVIDPEPFRISLDKAQAQLQQAQTRANQAERHYSRISHLIEGGAVSRKDYDDAASEKNATLSAVKIARAAVDEARLNLSYSQITAPVDGRIDRTLIHEGNLVSANEATLLTTIIAYEPLYVWFDMDEKTYLNSVSKTLGYKDKHKNENLMVSVGLSTENGYPHAGIIDFAGNQIERSTGTIRIRGVLHNTGDPLIPGAYARVKVETGKKVKTILIHDLAVGSDQSNKFVLLADENNKVQYRKVELGPVVDGLRVVTHGLNAGEKIIIKGMVRPGMDVTPDIIPMNSLPERETQNASNKSEGNKI